MNVKSQWPRRRRGRGHESGQFQDLSAGMFTSKAGKHWQATYSSKRRIKQQEVAKSVALATWNQDKTSHSSWRHRCGVRTPSRPADTTSRERETFMCERQMVVHRRTSTSDDRPSSRNNLHRHLRYRMLAKGLTALQEKRAGWRSRRSCIHCPDMHGIKK
jgi:hypothetical protein